MAAKSPKWLQESLKLRKITNKQPDTQKWVSGFQELHKFAAFSTRDIRIWHYTLIKPEETSKKASNTYNNCYITEFYFKKVF